MSLYLYKSDKQGIRDSNQAEIINRNVSLWVKTHNLSCLHNEFKVSGHKFSIYIYSIMLSIVGRNNCLKGKQQNINVKKV